MKAGPQRTETAMPAHPQDLPTAGPSSAPRQPAFAPGAAQVSAAHRGAVPGGAVQGGTPDGADAGTGPVAGAGIRQPAALSESPSLSPQARATLGDEFRAMLAGGVHGFCFSPYLEGQSPGAQVSAGQIRARLEVIRPHAGWVRTFSCTDGHEQTPGIAKSMGLNTLVGAWLGTDPEINAREIAGVIAVARAGDADIVAVGNEVLLRGDMDEDALIACIEHVKQALPGVPVGYVDAYYLFEQHPRVTAACDVVMTNCYPFWEGCPREQALPYMQSMLARTRAAAPGKRILVSETGWPDRGSPFHGAVPSEDGAMRYFIDTLRWARDEQIELFYFAAFDEAWKVGAEGDVGAYWGLWDKDAHPKFG
jgi:glucan 1,3-beta-glucosidase